MVEECKPVQWLIIFDWDWPRDDSDSRRPSQSFSLSLYLEDKSSFFKICIAVQVAGWSSFRVDTSFNLSEGIEGSLAVLFMSRCLAQTVGFVDCPQPLREAQWIQARRFLCAISTCLWPLSHQYGRWRRQSCCRSWWNLGSQHTQAGCWSCELFWWKLAAARSIHPRRMPTRWRDSPSATVGAGEDGHRARDCRADENQPEVGCCWTSASRRRLRPRRSFASASSRVALYNYIYREVPVGDPRVQGQSKPPPRLGAIGNLGEAELQRRKCNAYTKSLVSDSEAMAKILQISVVKARIHHRAGYKHQSRGLLLDVPEPNKKWVIIGAEEDEMAMRFECSRPGKVGGDHHGDEASKVWWEGCRWRRCLHRWSWCRVCAIRAGWGCMIVWRWWWTARSTVADFGSEVEYELCGSETEPDVDNELNPRQESSCRNSSPQEGESLYSGERSKIKRKLLGAFSWPVPWPCVAAETMVVPVSDIFAVFISSNQLVWLLGVVCWKRKDLWGHCQEGGGVPCPRDVKYGHDFRDPSVRQEILDDVQKRLGLVGTWGNFSGMDYSRQELRRFVEKRCFSGLLWRAGRAHLSKVDLCSYTTWRALMSSSIADAHQLLCSHDAFAEKMSRQCWVQVHRQRHNLPEALHRQSSGRGDCEVRLWWFHHPRADWGEQDFDRKSFMAGQADSARSSVCCFSGTEDCFHHLSRCGLG